jgi:hypothetical protein
VGATPTFLESTITAVVSSGALWGGVQWFLNRKQRKAEEERKKVEAHNALEEDRVRRLRVEAERREVLAEAQRTAQRTALESANRRYEDLWSDHLALREDNAECRSGLASLRNATWLLINVFDDFLRRLQPSTADHETYTLVLHLTELGEARRAINDARRLLRE